MTRALIAAALTATACAASAVAADFDGSKPLVCATMEAHDCDAGAACKRGLPGSVGAPVFVRIDFSKNELAGPKRTTTIKNIERSKEQIVVQGTELGMA